MWLQLLAGAALISAPHADSARQARRSASAPPASPAPAVVVAADSARAPVPRPDTDLMIVELAASEPPRLVAPEPGMTPFAGARELAAATWGRVNQLASIGPAVAIDSLVLEKQTHRLTLYSLGRPVRSYLVALGRNPVGDKEYQGDGRTPEGVFHIEARNANSRFHLALKISYPDQVHLLRAAALGRAPGGDIMIHGLPHGYETVGAAHREDDWTEGCVALTNEEIEEIFRMVVVGAPIEIKP